jgi:hypothetical protein
MGNPYNEMYDRRHLASRPHLLELRDRSLKGIMRTEWEGDRCTYHNKVIKSVPVCMSAFCFSEVTRSLDLTESGVDVFMGPVPVGQARFVSVAPLKGDGPHLCGACGKDVSA